MNYEESVAWLEQAASFGIKPGLERIKAMLEKLADSKEQGSSFVKDAALAVVVTGNPNDNDCWIEDGSIAATFMQLQATFQRITLTRIFRSTLRIASDKMHCTMQVRLFTSPIS